MYYYRNQDKEFIKMYIVENIQLIINQVRNHFTHTTLLKPFKLFEIQLIQTFMCNHKLSL